MIDGKGWIIFYLFLLKVFLLEVDEEFICIEFFERDKGLVVELMKWYVWLVMF